MRSWGLKGSNCGNTSNSVASNVSKFKLFLIVFSVVKS